MAAVNFGRALDAEVVPAEAAGQQKGDDCDMILRDKVVEQTRVFEFHTWGLRDELWRLEEFGDPGDFLRRGEAVAKGRAHRSENDVGVGFYKAQNLVQHFVRKVKDGHWLAWKKSVREVGVLATVNAWTNSHCC